MKSSILVHPFIIRLTHWLNVAALYIMVASGLRIYNASPLFNFAFPEWATLGGWLAGARQWHFFAMWLFVFNGVVWLLYNIASRHGRKTTIFRWRDTSGVWPMIQYYLRLKKEPPLSGKYNALQKLAYTTLPLVALMAVLSGLGIYWPVQLQEITSIFGDYEGARHWHFYAMSALVLFAAMHLILVISSGWYNFLSMITGREPKRKAKTLTHHPMAE